MTKITAPRLRELLNYDAVTGVFTRRVGAGNAKAGDIAGSVNDDGYRLISVDRRRYAAHRLAWLFVHGEWPATLVDHQDGKRDANAIRNLRDATRRFNAENQREPHRNSTSGFLGVTRHKQCDRWQATIRVAGKAKHLGLFTTPEAAHEAYLKAKRELHEGCTL